MMKRIYCMLLLIATGGIVHAQDISGKLDDYCKAAEATGTFHGTVMVKQKGKTLLSKGYGFSNAEERVRGNENTRYQVGSVTKQFTSTVILKLAEQGKIKLTDKLSRFYPKFPNANKVTIEQLLSHTSGIHNYTNDPKVFDSVRTLPVNEAYMVHLIGSYPYDFEPGTKWSYSNSGYALLGYIIQKLTKKPYEQVVRELILNPLGMTESGFDFKNAPMAKAIGYDMIDVENAKYVKALQVDSTVSFSAGSLYSTTADLAKWDAAFFSGKIISTASAINATTPRMNKYGLGLGVDTIHDKRVIQHGGGIDGFLCQNSLIPSEDLQIIVLQNSFSSNPGKMCIDLLAIALGKTAELPKKIDGVAVAEVILRSYEGEYQVSPGMEASILVKEGKLWVDTHNDPPAELIPESDSRFAFKTMKATIEFFKDASGKVEKFVFTEGSNKLEAKKIK